MDARVDPMDVNTHPDLVDLLRRSDFSEALNLFGKLMGLAHSQGQIDACVAVTARINNGGTALLEDEIRNAARRDQ